MRGVVVTQGSTGADTARAAAGQYEGHVLMVVPGGVTQFGGQEQHGVVQQAAVAVRVGRQLFDQDGESIHEPGLDQVEAREVHAQVVALLGEAEERDEGGEVEHDPGDLGAETKGKACIGDIATGQAKDGSGEKTFYIYNICDHEECYAEVGSQAVSYTTGVPAMIGAAQLLKGNWKEPGVWNMEQLDPDDFMDMLNSHGLPWQVHELDGPVDF